MFRLLRILCVLCGVVFMGNALGAGYVCKAVREYTSCSTGYYMTLNGTYNGTSTMGNACTVCDGTYCPGGTAAPLYRVSLNANGGTLGTVSALYASKSAGWYIGTTVSSAGTKITALTAAQLPSHSTYTFTGFWTSVSGGTQLIDHNGNFVSSNNYTSVNTPITLYAQYKDGCVAGTYQDGDSCSDCPPEWPHSDYGATSINDCYAKCDKETIANGTITAVTTTATYNNSCMYNITCNSGYATRSNPTSDPRCDAKCVKITLDSGDAGEDGAIYTRYNDKTSWYADAACSVKIDGITKPEYEGYTFAGYYNTQQSPLKYTGDVVLPAASYQRVGYDSEAISVSPGTSTAGATWWARWAQNCAPTSGATCQGPIYVSSERKIYYINCCLPGYTNTNYANTAYADSKGVCKSD